jgi:hypothetical protein
VLSEGETWYQDGVALTLVSADLRPAAGWEVGFEFRLENLTQLDLVVACGEDSFEIRNSAGDAFDVSMLSHSFLLESGQTKMLYDVDGDGDIVSSSVSSVTIRVLSLSRIRDARWSIPVYH